MPFIDPQFLEPMWCAGCGAIGIEHVERVKLDPPGPTKWARACPSCHDSGLRLVGDVVPGVWSRNGRGPGVAA